MNKFKNLKIVIFLFLFALCFIPSITVYAKCCGNAGCPCPSSIWGTSAPCIPSCGGHTYYPCHDLIGSNTSTQTQTVGCDVQVRTVTVSTYITKRCTTCSTVEKSTETSYGSWVHSSWNHSASGWSSVNGSTHHYVCTRCGVELGSGSHNMSGWGADNGSTHSRRCSTCGYTESGGHGFYSVCGGSHPGYDYERCGTCGYERNFNAHYYTTYYNSNKPGGASTTMTGSVSSQSCRYDVDFVLRSNSTYAYSANPVGFSLVGYRFDNWNTSPYGNGGRYGSGQTVRNLTSGHNGSITLYAIWKPITYTIEYYANKPSAASHNVTGSQAVQTCNYDTIYTFSQNSECAGGTGFSLIGWHFTGWNTKPDGTGTTYLPGESFINMTTVHGDSIKLYAQWEQNIHTIHYDKNTGLLQSGVDGSAKTVVKYEDSSFDLVNVYDLFYKTGYHIDSPVAWRFGSTSGSEYTELLTSSGVYLNPVKAAMECSKDVHSTVYANWIENTYTIHFDKNTPTRASSVVQGSMSDMSDLLWTRDYTLHSNNYSLVGWTFKGWSLSQTNYSEIVPGDFATIQYYNSQVINNKNDTKLSDDNEVVITLYAIWQENRYNVLFDGNNDTGTVTGSTPSMIDVLYESFVPLTLNSFGRTSPVNMEYRDGEWRNIDSDFLGWNYDTDDGQLVVFENGEVVSKLSPTNHSSVQLYAVWNDSPTFDIQAEFPDRYFTVADAQAGVITEEELLSTVTASDREGLLDIELVGYVASDYTSVIGPCILTQTYRVTDTYGRISYVTISVNILENESFESVAAQSIRGYDTEYYKYSDGQFVEMSEGGLASTSRWLTDDAYNAILEYSILNRGTDSNTIYSFSRLDLDNIKNNVLANGIGTNSNISLTDVFLRYVETTKKTTE